MKRITISDVAEHAGVSKSTVSQYLNKRYDYMGQKTKERIEQAVKELGYSPNIIARSLKQKSTMTIGVIVANILHVFSTQVIRAIEDFCNEKDFHVIICNADDDPKKEKRYIEMLQSKQVDGIIAFPTGGNVELYKTLIEVQFPVVFMDRIIPGLEIDTVALDNEKASFLAVEEFLRKGYREIGMLSPPLRENVTPRMERINGFKKALDNNQILFNQNYLMVDEINNIQGAMKKMLEQDNPPKALLALNDRVLHEVLAFTKKHRMHLPEDLAVIGIDEVSYAKIYSPALTTIQQPAFDMGKKAAELLFNRITNKNNCTGPKIYRFEPKLNSRESC
ncbi:substrate-binding domain-containing protein [Oceanobacillus caeni]|uniref:LacI family DNA-binding transcriptional regulator n=1 Tax=Bacillaceae TaxID=186817 RepID=UPI0011A8225F|nr:MULTISPECIES: substrate-binding domain-containing protein [Bacillaceae]MBU8791724.1 substrate-binding domain-containing protein [Oceanobacillus caeni]MCR1834561.1 substrate-binding domain-containing protein [Oceanobacillus caeni]MED4475002.1 substrate-binding domain-containing protein [Oceanobacillus caeni]